MRREGMDQLLAQIIPFVYIGVILYAANQSAQSAGGQPLLILRLLLYSTTGMTFFYGASVFLSSLSPLPDLPAISLFGGALALLVAGAAAAVNMAFILSPDFRRRLKPLLGARSTFDPDSAIHMTAVVLMLALTSFTISNFVVGGGISGLAETLETDGSAIPTLILTQAVWILAALLGVGLWIRRRPADVARRLGLRVPTPADFNWGLGFGLLSYGGVIGLIAVWTLVVTPEQFAEQTAASQMLAGIFTSLPQVLILSILIGIGEETFFRGAIQPVFGIGVTSVFFTILHTQYTLTPATLALFVVSLVFGWLRQRHSTSAAIIAHFVYNFVQLALGLLVAAP